MKMPKNRHSIVAGLASLLACLYAPASADAGSPPDMLASHIDRTVRPGEDFFDYANGAWFKGNPIPDSETSWGIDTLVRDQLQENLRSINEAAAARSAPAGTDEQKIGDFWRTAMDAGLAAREGIHPLDAQLAMIGAVHDRGGAIDAAFALMPLGIDVFASVSVYPDEKDSTLNAVHIAQGGLGLPERDFYFNDEPSIAAIREAYVAHVARMLVLLGRAEADARESAQGVMKFETALAKASRKLEDRRDPVKNYHRVAIADLHGGSALERDARDAFDAAMNELRASPLTDTSARAELEGATRCWRALRACTTIPVPPSRAMQIARDSEEVLERFDAVTEGLGRNIEVLLVG